MPSLLRVQLFSSKFEGFEIFDDSKSKRPRSLFNFLFCLSRKFDASTAIFRRLTHIFLAVLFFMSISENELSNQLDASNFQVLSLNLMS